MKILFYHSLATIILLLTITACNKDVTEAELLKNQLATADSLLKRGGVIKYSVKVISTCNSAILKAKMDVSNAQVTIYQNDSTYTAYTDADGLAIFPNMRVGTAAVNVKLKDHATVDYIADLTPADNLVNLSQSQIINTVRYASTMVPMFPIADPGAATITGKVTAELDLTNTTPEPAPGVTVTAMVDVTDSLFVETYIKPTEGSSSSQNAGRILKFAFQDAVVSAVTDDKGIYTLKVPAALNGLPVKLSVQDYRTTQKLYLENDPVTGEFKPSEYTVSVGFGRNMEYSSIPTVKPLYIIIDSPNCPFGINSSVATFKHTINSEGTITSVDVITKGKFSNKPAIIAVNNGKGAILDPVYNDITGEIESVTIINGGTGYKADGQGTVIRAYLTQEYKIAKLDLSVANGYLNKVTIIDYGQGYVTNPNFTLFSPSKNCTLPNLLINVYAPKMQLSSVTIINPGKDLKDSYNFPNQIQKGFYEQKISITSGMTQYFNLYLGTGNTN